MKTFNIGDKVRVVSDSDRVPAGSIGTVRLTFPASSGTYGIDIEGLGMAGVDGAVMEHYHGEDLVLTSNKIVKLYDASDDCYDL